MGFPLECQCGRVLDVAASQSGTTIPCDCGVQVRVPSLSKLRELAGKAPFESGVIDSILGMIERGELPAGDRCAVSGKVTADVIHLLVDAERIQRSRDFNPFMAVFFLFSPIFILLLREDNRPAEGRETTITVPLRVSAEHHAKVRRSGQWALRRWLRSVPIYATLLKEYPLARIRVARAA